MYLFKQQCAGLWQQRVTLAALCASLLGPAHAQDTSTEPAPQTVAVRESRAAAEVAVPVADSPQRLPEVVVTADKLGRREGQGNESVRVVSAAELEQANARDLYDVLRRVANVNVNEGNSAQRGGFAIRGIVDTGPGADGIGSSSALASVTVDGVILSTQGNAAGPIDTWDLAQVEVLRGPQSTTQGRNALAGAIVLRSQDPTPFWDFKALLQGGELGSRQAAVAGGGPLGDELAFRLAYNLQRDDGAVTNVTRGRDDWDNGDSRRGRAKLSYSPEFWQGAHAQYTHADSDVYFGDAVVSRARAAQGERVSESSEDEYTQVDSTLDSLELELPFGDGALTSVTGSSRTTRYQQYDFNRSAQPDDGVIRFDNADDGVNQELRYRHAGERVQWVAGVFAGESDEALDIRIRDAVVPLFAGLEVVLDGDIASRQDKVSRALFAEADWQLLPRWTLTAGLRYDRERVEYAYDGEYRVPRGSLNGVPLPGAPLEPLVDQSGALPPDAADSGRADFAVWLPKLGLTHALTPAQTLGATLQRGYRSGGVSINPVRGTLVQFAPEFTDNIELAWRARWLDAALRSRINLFYLNWRDQQVDVPLSENPLDTQTENAGRSRLYGGEAELRWRASAALELWAGVGLTRTQFIDFTSSVGDNFKGNEFPNAPRTTGQLGLAWQAASGWFVDADVGVQAGSFRRPNNDPVERNDGRTLLNARVGWENAALTVFVAGRNLGDAYYVSSKAGNGATVGEPRVISGGLEWRLR